MSPASGLGSRIAPLPSKPAEPVVRLSVCIPSYSAPAEMLQQSIDSATSQLPAGSELLLFPNGPSALTTLQKIRVPQEAKVVPSAEVLGQVANFNRCLAHAAGDLIHILHEDDAVAPGFYEVILDLASMYPNAAIYATASEVFTGGSPKSSRSPHPHSSLLEGLEAARFFLDDDRHSCGNVVLTRRAVEELGGFRTEFPYVTDEEAYLRYAFSGGVGFNTAPLYWNRTHRGQLRVSTWLSPDFVEMYLRSRLEGARRFGEDAMRLALRSTEKRVISVAVTLALLRFQAESRQRLAELERCLNGQGSSRIWIAKLFCKWSPLLSILSARRRSLVWLRRRRTRA